MNPARYRINGTTYTFIAVNPVYWLLEDDDGVLWRAHGSEIRERMTLTRDRHAPDCKCSGCYIPRV